jgi:hypothetical protein
MNDFESEFKVYYVGDEIQLNCIVKTKDSPIALVQGTIDSKKPKGERICTLSLIHFYGDVPIATRVNMLNDILIPAFEREAKKLGVVEMRGRTGTRMAKYLARAHNFIPQTPIPKRLPKGAGPKINVRKRIH